ncbi:hypothetical protein Tco_0393762, partial [Tanacetum coccineum]
LWKLIGRKQSLWVKWVSTVKLKTTSIWEIESTNSDSWGWKNMLMLRDKIKPFVRYKVGNGKYTSAWHDKWCSIGTLDRFITKSFRFAGALSKSLEPISSVVFACEFKIYALLVDSDVDEARLVVDFDVVQVRLSTL